MRILPWINIKVFLDDERMPSQVYDWHDDFAWVVVRNIDAAKKLLLTRRVSHISLDNDLGDGQKEGHVLLYWMIENDIWPSEEVYVHSANIVRAPQMRADAKRWFYDRKK